MVECHYRVHHLAEAGAGLIGVVAGGLLAANYIVSVEGRIRTRGTTGVCTGRTSNVRSG